MAHSQSHHDSTGLIQLKQSVGKWSLRFSWMLVLVCVAIPMTVLYQETHSDHIVSVWWLRDTPIAVSSSASTEEQPRWLKKRIEDGNVHVFRSLAFSSCCSHTAAEGTIFPFTDSEPSDKVPWIWDAAVTGKGNMVSVLLLSRKASCTFDRLAWTKSLSKYSVNVSSAVYVSESRVVPGHPVESRFSSSNSFRHRMLCKYYNQHNVMLTTVRSLVMVDDVLVRCPLPSSLHLHSRDKLRIRLQTIPQPLSSAVAVDSRIVSICPLWTRHSHDTHTTQHGQHGQKEVVGAIAVNLEESLDPALALTRDLVSGLHSSSSHNNFSLHNNNHNNNNNHETGEAREGMHDEMFSQKDRNNKLFNFSVCTTSSSTSVSVPMLLEWIEYHRELGVQHFFIYDTSFDHNHRHAHKHRASVPGFLPEEEAVEGSTGQGDDGSTKRTTTSSSSSSSTPFSLTSALLRYSHAGIVTVVPWHYGGCGHSQALCATTTIDASSVPRPSPSNESAGLNGGLSAVPPALLDLAIQSCYMRFKFSSSWMTALSTDEFIGIDLNQTDSLYDLVEGMTSTHTNLAAIEMKSSPYVSCELTEKTSTVSSPSSALPPKDASSVVSGWDEEASVIPPRISSHSHSKRWLVRRSKQLVRTELVVHVDGSGSASLVELSDTSRLTGSLKLGEVGDVRGLSSAMTSELSSHPRPPAKLHMSSHTGAHVADNEYTVARADKNSLAIAHFRSSEDLSFCADLRESFPLSWILTSAQLHAVDAEMHRMVGVMRAEEESRASMMRDLWKKEVCSTARYRKPLTHWLSKALQHRFEAAMQGLVPPSR